MNVRQKKWRSDWNWHPKRPLGETLLGLFGKKRFVIGISLLIIVLGGFILSGGPLFHSIVYAPNNNHFIDPTTTIWATTGPNNDVSEFNTVNTFYCGACAGGGAKGIELAPLGAGVTAVALSKSTIGDVGLVAAKDLFYRAQYGVIIGSAHCCGNKNTDQWGFYLTTNGTLPTQSGNYNPYTDPSVAMLVQIYTLGGGVYSNTLFIQRTIGQAINVEDAGGCAPSTSCLSSVTDNINPTTDRVTLGVVLNYTTQGSLSTGCVGSSGGPGCSELAVGNSTITPPSVNGWTQEIPWFRIQGEQYYAGFYYWSTSATPFTVGWNFEQTHTVHGVQVFEPNDVAYYVPGPSCTGQANGPCFPDTGGFFGPVIKALISIGVFILQQLLLFISFIAPAIQSALSFLESIIQAVLNLIGNALGFGNVGTTLFSLLGSIVTFFTNGTYGFPAFFGFFGTYITNFLRYLQIDFQFLTPIFTIANAILIFGVNGIAEAFVIFLQGVNMLFFGYGTFIVFGYFLYVGDDGIGGLFTFLGTLEAISFKILNSIVTVTNVGLDFLVTMVSLVPKPFIQMSAARIPRLPTVEYAASMSFPSLDFGEARNGNLIVYWLWCMGLWFMCWFETQNPALPGSLVAIDPALATNIRNLSAFLPLLQAVTLISGGLVLAWFAMLPMRLAGIDVTESPLGASLGRRAGPGPGGVKISGGKKHLVGPAKKAEEERQRKKGHGGKAEKEAKKAIEEQKKKLEKEKRDEELRKREIERKPTGKDIKGPNLGPLGPQ